MKNPLPIVDLHKILRKVGVLTLFLSCSLAMTYGQRISKLSTYTGPEVANTPNTPTQPNTLQATPCANQVTLTQSSSQAVTSSNSISCNGGNFHNDNSYWRVFTLVNPFTVSSVQIGVEFAKAGSGQGGSQPITVRIYKVGATPFPTNASNLILLQSADFAVTDQSFTIIDVPIVASLPANSQMVVEIFTPDGHPEGNSFFIGSNANGQSGASYILAADCGVTAPTTLASLGSSNMHIVMNVIGCECSVSPNPSFAPICLLGNPLNLSASGGSSYSWTGPNGFKSNSATPSKSKTVAKDEGVYSVTVSSTLGCTATSTIKVYIGVGKITATSNSTVCKGGTIQLSANAEFGASYKWTKQFSSQTYFGQNPSIPNAQTSNGGVYIVFVTGVNGCIGKKEVLVTVSPVPCVSPRLAIGEIESEIGMEINAYPNPTSKLLSVEVKLAKPSALKLNLYNATGNTLNEWALSEESTIHRKEIDMSLYKDGLYLIQAQSKDGKQIKRVVRVE